MGAKGQASASEEVSTNRNSGWITSPWAKELIAGAFGGAIGTLVCQPFDLIKVRAQNATTKVRPGQIVRSVLKREGPLAFWKGLMYPLLTNSLQNSVVFYTYSSCLKVLGAGPHETNTNSHSPATTIFMAGGLAGILQSFVSAPVENLKIKSQIQTAKSHTSSYKKVSPIKLVREHGVRGLFKGLNATIVRDMPSYGLYFLMYDSLRDAMVELTPAEKDGPLDHLVAGGVTGAAVWLAVYPVDVVKTQIQSTYKDKSFVEILNKIRREKGLSGFSSGLYPCLARGFVMNAVIFAVYEATMQYMDGSN